MIEVNEVPAFPGLAHDVMWTWQHYDPDEWPQMLSWLSEEERAALESYGSEKRRVEFVLGRAAARRLVSRVTGAPHESIRLEVAADGAVEIADQPHHLSISHANGWATAVISPRSIGIDMERLTARSPGVYRYFLARDEYRLLEGSDLDHDSLQILLWTLKEAVLKGTRTGLRVSPKDVRILSLDPTGMATARDRERRTWRLSWIFWLDCYLAIADLENLP